MKKKLNEEIIKIASIMGVKQPINEGFNLNRIFSNFSSIADDLIAKIVSNTERLTELSNLAAIKDNTKSATQWLSELRSATKNDWEDLLSYTGKLKFIFSSPHSALLYLVENSSKAADDVMAWMERTDVSDLDKEEIKELLAAIRTGKGWTKESPDYISFKGRGKMPENISWVNAKTTKTVTKYFADISDEQIFRDWINVFEDGKYAEKYDIDIYQPGVTKSDWPGLGEALKDPYIKQHWVNATRQRALLQQGDGVWKLPTTKKLYLGKNRSITVSKNPFGWYTKLPKPGQWIVGIGTAGVIGLSTAPIWLPWIAGLSIQSGAESAQKVYENLQKQIDEFLRGFKDETVDGPLVRNIFDETVTLATLQTKYDTIPWSSYIAITDEEAKDIANQLLIPSFKQPTDTEIPKFSSSLSNAIKMRIYGLVPDGISLMKVVEEFKKLPESKGKNPHDYYFDQLTYYFTKEKNELNENTYINMTNAPSGEGMVLTVLLPTQILSIVQPDLKIDKNFLNKLKSGEIKFQIPKIDEQELETTKSKVETLILPSTWVMKPSKDGARYKGISLNGFSDWGEGCAAKVGTEDKLKSELKKIIVSYLETQTRKKIKLDDLFLTDNIVEYVNSKFPCEELRGLLDFADPNILTKGDFAPKDYTPKPVEVPRKQQGGETPKPNPTPVPFVPIEDSIINKVGLAKLLTEQTNTKDWFMTLFQETMNTNQPGWYNGKNILNTDANYGVRDAQTNAKFAESVGNKSYTSSRKESISKYFVPDYGQLFRFITKTGNKIRIISANDATIPEFEGALNQFRTNLIVAFYCGVMSVPEYKNQIVEVQVSDDVANILKNNQTDINKYLQ
jgi:hypothetical protein